jgi:hypothetical protein
VLVRDSIISEAELHRHARCDPAADSPTPRASPEDTATVRYLGPTRDRRPTGDAARQRVRDRNAMEADIARGPVPGYAGVMIQGGCTFVVLLTDTLTQKRTAEAYFRVEAEKRRPGARSNCGGPYRLAFRQVRYDFAQLYDWYVGPFRSIPWDAVTMTDIDEARNQLAIGVEDSAAQERVRRSVETLSIPRDAVRVDVVGKMCVGTGGP